MEYSNGAFHFRPLSSWLEFVQSKSKGLEALYGFDAKFHPKREKEIEVAPARRARHL
jgi:hypothetical protein